MLTWIKQKQWLYAAIQSILFLKNIASSPWVKLYFAASLNEDDSSLPHALSYIRAALIWFILTCQAAEMCNVSLGPFSGIICLSWALNKIYLFSRRAQIS